jgi:tetratricopeptide (TPR) repeat protein
VFVGGATLEAIEAVCNPDGELDVLEGVESLLELNLLRQMGEEEPRFVMLETIHEYARERLDEGGETDVLRRQHVAYYLAIAEQAEAGLHGPEQGDWLVRLEDEHDNVRAALAWCLDAGEHRIAGPGTAPAERTAAGVRLAGALWWFWYLHAHRREGLQWLEKALSQSTAAPASRWDLAPGQGAEAATCAGGRRAPADPRAARAKVALGAARIAWEQHPSEQGKKSASWCQARLEESVALYREVGDRYGVADALSAIGLLARRQAGKDRRFGVDRARGTALLEESLTLARELGEPWLVACILERLASTADLTRDAERARAREQAEESLRLFQEVGDTLEIAIVQRVLGQIALYERDYARARAAFSEDLATTRALGDKIGIAVGLTNLGDVAREEGDLTGAAALYEESLALWRDLGSVNWGIPWALLGLGDLCLQRGDHAAARSCFAESLMLARQENQIAASLEALAGLAAMQGQPARALRLAAAAAALRDRIGEPPWPANQAALTRRLAAAREALSAEGQAAAWADGQALTVEQAVAEALGKAQED